MRGITNNGFDDGILSNTAYDLFEFCTADDVTNNTYEGEHTLRNNTGIYTTEIHRMDGKNYVTGDYYGITGNDSTKYVSAIIKGVDWSKYKQIYVTDYRNDGTNPNSRGAATAAIWSLDSSYYTLALRYSDVGSARYNAVTAGGLVYRDIMSANNYSSGIMTIQGDVMYGTTSKNAKYYSPDWQNYQLYAFKDIVIPL